MARWTEFLNPDGADGAYLPWKRVETRVGISRTTAWRLQRSGDFPKPYVVSPGRVAYKESEVEAWKASRGHRVAGPPPPPSRAAVALDPPSPSSIGSQPPATEQPALSLEMSTGAQGSQPPRAAPKVRSKAEQPDQMRFDF